MAGRRRYRNPSPLPSPGVFTTLATARARLRDVNKSLNALAAVIHNASGQAREVILSEIEDDGDKYEPSEAWFWRTVAISYGWTHTLEQNIEAYERRLHDRGE